MADPRWWMVPYLSLIINDIIMTSLPLLLMPKVINILAIFLILSDTLLNLGTQVGAQNNDFGAVFQSLVLSLAHVS